MVWTRSGSAGLTFLKMISAPSTQGTPTSYLQCNQQKKGAREHVGRAPQEKVLASSVPKLT